MRAITRFALKNIIITTLIALALVFVNLYILAEQIPEQDTPQDCQKLYGEVYRACTTSQGLCTRSQQQCILEHQLQKCLYGWEKIYWFFGMRYCTTKQTSIYNNSNILRTCKWPYLLALSVVLIIIWLLYIFCQFKRLKAKIS